MLRAVLVACWFVSLGLAFLAGYRVASKPDPGPAPAALPARVDSAPVPSEFDRLLRLGAGPALADYAVASGAGSRLLEAVEALADAGRVPEALTLLEAYLALEVRSDALFALADLLMMDGRLVDALEPLFRIVEYPDSIEVESRARQRLELIINTREQQLANVDDLAGLVAFYETLSEREPAFDGHRLKLALWLLRSGELTDAAGVLAQVGYVGVTEAEREAVSRELELASAPLPFERAGAGFYAEVTARGRGAPRRLRLLVDTGATTTGLSAEALRRLGAERLERQVRVNTASGAATMPVYRLESLTVGEIEVGDLLVLGLPQAPREADGLLGMDVLDQLPKRLGTP